MARSHPGEFFDYLKDREKRAFVELNRLIERCEDENQWRDFREAAWLFSGTSSTAFSAVVKIRDNRDKLRRIWSENLGAFANSGGGILIWGIKALKRKAEKPSLAPDAQGLADWLSEQQANATDPSVQGVRVLPVFEGKGLRSGFVVCLIPSSRLAPHRSIWAERSYYGRFDDGNKELPTELLRRMFYPQVSAFLIPQALFRFRVVDLSVCVECDIFLKNEGMASAVNTVVDIEGVFECRVPVSPSYGWKATNPGMPDRIVAESAIHPGETVLSASVSRNFGNRSLSDLALKFRIFSANSPAIQGHIYIPAQECDAAARNSSDIKKVAKMGDVDVARFEM